MSARAVPRLSEYIGLFCTACGTLLFELSVTRIFAVTLWSNYAFLVVSTALFGFGFSGVYLSLWSKSSSDRHSTTGSDFGLVLGRLAIASGLAMVLDLVVIILVPLRLPDLSRAVDWLALALHYLMLALPFFFSGQVVARLLDARASAAARLYCWDLVGAGLGCYLIVPLLPKVAAQGTIFFAVLLMLIAAALFMSGTGGLVIGGDASRRLTRWLTAAAAMGVASGILVFRGASAFELRFHNEKRSFREDVEAGRIEFTQWSALSRVDVAAYRESSKRIWINGGTNESLILRPAELLKDAGGRDVIDYERLAEEEGLARLYLSPHRAAALVTNEAGRVLIDLDRLGPLDAAAAEAGRKLDTTWDESLETPLVVEREAGTERPTRIDDSALARVAAWTIHWVTLPHLIKDQHTVLVIGTAGGSDALTALQYGARFVTGVEMDPVVAETVLSRYAAFAGHLFQDSRSALIVDEGRSYLKRGREQYDVIQQVNNFTPIAFANGALNLSEAYLLTVESMMEFWEHLTAEGILCLNRQGVLRCALLAREAMRRLGVSGSAGDHLVCMGPVPGSGAWTRATLLWKKSPFTPDEVRAMELAARAMPDQQLYYAPHRPPQDNLYYDAILAADPSPYYRYAGFNLAPPTDDRPFFDHMQLIGVKEDRDDPRLPREMTGFRRKKLDRRVPVGDMPVVGVLFEAMLFASLFIIWPMARYRRSDLLKPGSSWALLYFFCLGLAFILIEICLMQRLVLFLGSPVYSISTVLFSLLVFAGLGSLLTARFNASSQKTFLAVFAVLLPLVLLGLASYPWLVRNFIHLGFRGRVALSVLYLAPMAVTMGMPFPLGIRLLDKTHHRLIPWAWALNGYATVVGSALSVLLAILFGFRFVYVLAMLIYMVGCAAIVAHVRSARAAR